MARRKSRGRITAEEANELFQKPLELLHQPPSSLDLIPASGSVNLTLGSRPNGTGVHHAVPSAEPKEIQVPSPRILATQDQLASVRPSPLDGVVQKLRLAAGRIWMPTSRTSPRLRISPEASTTSELAARLEADLIEASCLAAELQRRHREAHAEHQRAIDEIRDMVNVLVEQVDRSRIARAVEEVAAATQDVPEPPRSETEHARSKQGPRLVKSLEEDAV